MNARPNYNNVKLNKATYANLAAFKQSNILKIAPLNVTALGGVE